MRTLIAILPRAETLSLRCWLPIFLSQIVLSFPSTTRAAEPLHIEGRFVAVPAPTSELVNRIRTSTNKDLERFKNLQEQRPANERREFKVIFDFNPDERSNHSDRNNYGVCRDLALHIQTLRLQGVKTTAFVHGPVSGHSVLPVLACGSIVMSDNAKLGPVIPAEATPLEEDERVAYRKFSGHRLATALVDKLYDRNLIVVASATKQGTYVGADSPDASNDPTTILFRRDTTATYNFKLAKQTGLCEQDPIRTRVDLANHLDLPRSSLAEHPLLLDKIVAGRITITGTINKELFEDLQRRVQVATGDGVNLLILELRCGRGETADALQMARYLRQLNKDTLDTPMLTVAWVTADARDTALYLALACDMFLIAPSATLGDFRDVLQGKNPEEVQAAARDLETLAREQCYPPRLVRGLVDPNIKSLFVVSSTRGGLSREVLTAEEVDADRREEKPRWTVIKEIRKSGDGVLTLSSTDAVEYKLAHGEAEELDAVYRSFGLQKGKVKEYGDDWINDLKRFLCHPVTSFFLVMLGITCLILELKIPGATLPGVIAAICFVLFFWSHSQLAGQITWLAILLFMLGIILLGIEIFVLPGFGVCGVSGLILTFGSLALVAYGQWPRTSAQWIGFGHQIGWLGLSLIGAIGTAILLGRFLPTVPIVNRLFLTPDVETADGALPGAPLVAPEIAGLLGAIGVAATPLRPAGKVQFGEQFIDVVTESSYVVPGTRVQVIEIEGNRVVVKEV